jgi:transcriptional regulator with XRE-family HTH domain
MDAADLIRAVRRRAGLSQRALADRVGASPRTVAAWEARQHSPSVAILDRVLAVADLDVALVPRLPAQAHAAIRSHLSLSLTQRLRIALGESPVLPSPARSSLWAELGRLARRGQLLLEPPVAVALWVPIGPVQKVSASLFHQKASLTPGHIGVQLREGDAPHSAIPFFMEVGQRLWVEPPGVLALPDEEHVRLRTVDQLLHAQGARDDAGRRRPAHRDPDESGEDWRLLRTKGVLNRPDMRDGRGWRLGAAASLAQRLRDG